MDSSEEKRLEYFISIFLIAFLLMIGLIYKNSGNSNIVVEQTTEDSVEYVSQETTQEDLLGVDFSESDQPIVADQVVQENLDMEDLPNQQITFVDPKQYEDSIFEIEEIFEVQKEGIEDVAEPTVEFDEKMVNQINEIGNYLSAVKDEELTDLDFTQKAKNFDVCRLEELGLEFNCDLNWSVSGEQGVQGAILLSSDPKLSMAFEDYSKDIRFLAQLTKTNLEKMGRYQEGFKFERTVFAGMDAVVVRAFSNQNPDVRHLDYYYIYKDKLFSINFMVEPKNRWDEVKFVIKEVVESFTSIDQYSSLVK